jgi:hypothetical protein
MAADLGMTIYNDGYGVVRESVPLELGQGETAVTVTGMSTEIEPETVVLRDPRGRTDFRVIEQNYRADTASEARLLEHFEGESIPFLVRFDDGEEIVNGKVVRSGRSGGAPIILQADGRLRFGLPGTPLFPGLPGESVLTPTLHWRIESPRAATIDAELAYITRGLSWKADYNAVGTADGTQLDLVGWVTMRNATGRAYEQARIKLLAGEVARAPQAERRMGREMVMARAAGGGPEVEEKAFAEYHLYTLPRPTTLRDRETKQVEFLRAEGVASRKLYVLDSRAAPSRPRGPQYGAEATVPVWVMREFENREPAGLGMPLPAGTIRFYQRDGDGQLEFTGENVIEHTPKDETIRVHTGNAFDIRGTRLQTNQQQDSRRRRRQESYEIAIRNHKEEAVTVRVVEHLDRWGRWEVTESSMPWTASGARAIEFAAEVPADGETTVSYTVVYTW